MSRSSRLLRNLKQFLRKNNFKASNYYARHLLYLGPKVAIGSQICCAALKPEDRPKINIEDGLRIACEEGDIAVIQLMDRLKDFVVVVSREYRNCLAKQIEITQTASQIGHLSDLWDELPHYRTLADELNKELNDYMAVFNTIGQMTNEKSLQSFVTGSKDKLDVIVVKYKDLDSLLRKEFALNREIEIKLLKINRDSILQSAI